MLQALSEAGIEPDLVVGTSVGAINGAVVAAHPAAAGVERLTQLWENLAGSEVFAGTLLARATTLLRTRTHLHSPRALRALLERTLPPAFEDLEVPFQCVAASIERAAARWFVEGPLVPAILASSAVPGLFPPVEIDGEHHMDGGLVHSIPVGRAIEAGATEVFVLHTGRIESPLARPRNPVDVAFAAFEIARRHRFVEETDRLSETATIHVLPAAATERFTSSDLRQFRYRDGRGIAPAIERARAATASYLTELRGD